MAFKRAYGRIADLPDQRDHRFGVQRRVALKLPATLDLRATNYGIDDQGQLGSCVGHGTEGAYRNLLAHEKAADFQGSRLGVYYCARALEGTTKQDAGAQIRDGVKAIAQTGVMPESLWPYLVSKFATKPPAAAYTAAKKHLTVEYQAVDNADWDAIRGALFQNGNLIIGITVYASFESDAVAKNGKVPMPGKKEAVLGGHCMRAVGYTADALIVANSWSPSWGDKGFCYLPKAYCLNPQLSSDWWTLQKA